MQCHVKDLQDNTRYEEWEMSMCVERWDFCNWFPRLRFLRRHVHPDWVPQSKEKRHGKCVMIYWAVLWPSAWDPVVFVQRRSHYQFDVQLVILGNTKKWLLWVHQPQNIINLTSHTSALALFVQVVLQTMQNTVKHFYRCACPQLCLYNRCLTHILYQTV